MSRQFKNGLCSCWKKVNKELEKEGCQLAMSFTFKGHHYMNIKTEPLRNGKVIRAVVASHCPFCGNKLKSPTT